MEASKMFQNLYVEYQSVVLLNSKDYKRGKMSLGQYINSLKSTLGRLEKSREKLEYHMERDLGNMWDIWVDFAECESFVEKALKSAQVGICAVQ